MVIQHYGLQSFKIVLGGMTVSVNPVSKRSESTNASFGADIVLVSVDHPDMNGVGAVSRGDKEPFVISGPGEYEVQDVFVRGFATPAAYDGKTLNTMYLIRMEDMELCFLGAMHTKELPVELEEVNVLFVPIAGGDVLSPKDAHALSVSIEPNVVIPMQFAKPGEKITKKKSKVLQQFLKEEGESNGAPIEKLTLKKKDLAEKSGDVVVLAAL